MKALNKKQQQQLIADLESIVSFMVSEQDKAREAYNASSDAAVESGEIGGIWLAESQRGNEISRILNQALGRLNSTVEIHGGKSQLKF